MWYFSFHGGTGGINNIQVYHDSGKPHDQPNLLPTSAGDPTLQELRGFQIVGNLLYVINAYKKNSEVLCYQGAGTDYVFKQIFASNETIRSIFHPYDLCFDSQGVGYVSSQDSNVVTAINAAGVAAPVAPYLLQQNPTGQFLPGTFVASSVGALPGVAAPVPPNVAAPQGLLLSYTDDTDSRVLNSVRGVLHYLGDLFVCDEVADTVKVFDGISGALKAQIGGKHLQVPVQLLVGPKQVLYIASSKNDSVVSFDLSGGVPHGVVEAKKFIDGEVKHISGMSFGGDGKFYAAERKAKKIKCFEADGSKGKDFISDLPDEPEFIMYVPH